MTFSTSNPMMDHVAQGSMMFIIDIDTENGGMQMNNDFCVDFGDEPDGPALAHEVCLYDIQTLQNPNCNSKCPISKHLSVHTSPRPHPT